MPLLDLDSASLSRALLWLPSPDALRAGQATARLGSLFGVRARADSGPGWRRLLGDEPPGRHWSSGLLWLHGAAAPADIARYAAMARHFGVLDGGLTFRGAGELRGLASAALLERDAGGEGAVFAGLFDVFAAAGDGTLRSRPKSLSSTYRDCHLATFDVCLTLGPAPGGGAFSGEIRQEEMDYISGSTSLATPCSQARAAPTAIACTVPVPLGGGPPGAAAALERARARGGPLLCLLRVLFRSAGMEQPVAPAEQARAARRSTAAAAAAAAGESAQRVQRALVAAGSRLERHEASVESAFNEHEFEAFLSTAHARPAALAPTFVRQADGRIAPMTHRAGRPKFANGGTSSEAPARSVSGAVDQPVHADTMHGVTRFLQSDVQLPVGEALGEADEDADADVGEVVRAVATDTALIFTALVALQDVEPDMGPTFVWPATHTVEHHATLWSTNGGGKLRVHEADKVFGVEHLKMTLRRGDAVIYDSRLMHCGSGSTSDQRRSVMVASVMGPGIRPDGTTWTMMKSLRSRLPRLGAFPLQDWALSAAAAPGRAVALPPPEAATAAPAAHGTAVQEEQPEVRPVPPLQEWEAAVQCSLCRRWRPCGTMEAPKLTGVENGFVCKAVGFSCLQERARGEVRGRPGFFVCCFSLSLSLSLSLSFYISLSLVLSFSLYFFSAAWELETFHCSSSSQRVGR
ncbi:unnamed protein product [Prorocentrum cordatum]|uniref:Uncharacterized protein n=1 Tax=Prorocentrum cordatum TaxID=2364126 RepID=A0ABN9UGW5_9DINO|nr:unnamed protein product [Polarella glacialis]